MMDIGALRMAQQDGGAPTTLAAGSAPGESGVSVLNFRFDGGMHLLATPRCHCICFEMSQVRVEKRMAGRIAHYERPVGSLTINPAGYDFAADADEDVEILVVAVDPGRMALAAAEGALPEAQLIERLGGEDPALFALARTLAFENVHNYPSGALSWNEAASSFVDGLVGATPRRCRPGRAARSAKTSSGGSGITSPLISMSRSVSRRSRILRHAAHSISRGCLPDPSA